MSQLKAGFARVNVTPMMGIRMQGYYEERLANGVLDELEVVALALENNGKQVVMLTLDNCFILNECNKYFKEFINEATGLTYNSIYIAATHSHTAPYLRLDSGYELEAEYIKFVARRMADAAKFALDDLQAAKAGYGVGTAPEIAFVRRHLMKDGSIKTNPARNDPDIVCAVGEPDNRVNVLRFDREGGDHIVLVNYGNHPDVIGGCKISGDWPSHLRRDVEKVIDNSKCIVFNGCQGNVNHVDFHPTRTEKDFMDDCGAYRGYGHSKYMARALAGVVAQVYDKAQAMEDTHLRSVEKTFMIPTNKGRPEQLEEAYRIHEAWKNGAAKAGLNSGDTMGVPEANRIVQMVDEPDFYDTNIMAIAIGKLVFVGIPGEPFTGVSFALKETPGWDLVFPTALTNGYRGYFPMQSDYDSGCGYEVVASKLKAGVAERIIAAGQELMNELKDK